MTGGPGSASRPGGLPEPALLLLLFLVVAAAFLPSLRNGFVDWDDHVTILTNPSFRGLGWNNLRWMFTTFLLGPYQPLSWMSLGADYLVWGLNPAGYHLTSLLLHAGNAVLFFLAARRLLSLALPGVAASSPQSIAGGAILASLFFALHPLRVESVAWVTERRDVLSAFFLLLSLLAYLGASQAVRGPGADAGRRFPLAALALFAMALLSKASVATFPLVLLVIDVAILRRLRPGTRTWRDPEQRGVLLEKLPFMLLGLVFAVVAVYGQAAARAVRTLEESSLAERAAYALYGTGFYLWKTVAPFRLSPLYEAPGTLREISVAIAMSGALFLTVSALLKLRRSAVGLGAAWLSYLALLAPVAGLVHVGTQIAADRYTYLPCLAWAVLVGAGLARVLARGGHGGRAAIVVSLLVVAGLALLTTRQIPVWRDTLSLWQHTVRLAPGSSIAQYGLGEALGRRGRVEEAMAAYRKAIQINPRYADARNNLATLLAERGQLEQAREQFLAIESIYPKDATLQYNIGLVESRMGNREAAKGRYRAALARMPALASARVNLALLLEEDGETETARALLLEGLALAPADSLVARALEHLPRAAGANAPDR